MVTNNQDRKPSGKVGRPTLYRPEMDELAKRACEQFNCTDAALGKILGVTHDCIKRWIDGIMSFRVAVKEGRDAHDVHNVETALLSRAMGFECDEIETKEITLKLRRRDGEGSVEVPAIQTTRRHRVYPPDVLAGMFWLSNRAPYRWRHTSRIVTEGSIDHRVSGSVQVDPALLPTAELEQLRVLLVKAVVQANKEDTSGRGGEDSQGDTQLSSRRKGRALLPAASTDDQA